MIYDVSNNPETTFMKLTLLKKAWVLLILSACSLSKNNQQVDTDFTTTDSSAEPLIAADQKPQSLMDLPQTQTGGFILAPGFYEASFKTYCLQPGTPDPAAGDAYLPAPLNGYRKEIVETVLYNSREYKDISQKNIQLLLWSIVSGSDFNKLSPAVQGDAVRLLSSKQIFQLKGGVIGVIKQAAYSSGALSANSDIQRLFNTGIASYESFERLAVRREAAKIIRHGVKADKWYKQDGNYYIRYFPAGYQQTRIQVYVPDGLLDAENKMEGEYIVFDPTGKQAIPAFTNAQRLGIGGPVLDIVKVIIQVNKKQADTPRKKPEPKKEEQPADTPNRKS